MVKPGGGEEYITTPVGRSATLQCSIINASVLLWRINGFDPLSHDSEVSGFTLHQDGPIIASTGELTSTLTVNGNIGNKGIEICCQTERLQECCMYLTIYGNNYFFTIMQCKTHIHAYTDHPSSPENITIQSTKIGSINITWDAESVAGVDQYYIINLTSNMSIIRTTKPFLTLNQSIHDIQCGTSLLITAVNGAGESSPSTFILPSLPDIGPVTASLEHQVWKVNGEIFIRVSFEVSLQFC